MLTVSVGLFIYLKKRVVIMREELKAARLREEAAVNSRREMIAELSHDIKTPVASIKAMVDFMMLTTDNKDQQETLASINSRQTACILYHHL